MTGAAKGAARDADHVCYGRILVHQRHKLAQQLLHGLERAALVGLNRADERARVLLREEALRDVDVEAHGEVNRRQGHQQHQELIARRTQTSVISYSQRMPWNTHSLAR